LFVVVVAQLHLCRLLVCAMTLSAVIFIFLVSLTWYVLCNCLGSGANSSEDERSLSLLNKLIGAQILVQCTEQAASSAGVTVTGDNKTNPQGSVQSFTSSTEERSADGTVKKHFFSRSISTLKKGQQNKSVLRFPKYFWFFCVKLPAGTRLHKIITQT
jgi:hypothetical protein